MSACCLSVYAKSPGLAMDGVVRRNCAGEKRRRELASEGRMWKGCGSRDLYDDVRGKLSAVDVQECLLPADEFQCTARNTRKYQLSQCHYPNPRRPVWSQRRTRALSAIPAERAGSHRTFVNG